MQLNNVIIFFNLLNIITKRLKNLINVQINIIKM